MQMLSTDMIKTKLVRAGEEECEEHRAVMEEGGKSTTTMSFQLKTINS